MGFSFVFGIIQDQRGFIWLAGAEGVSRYDGYEFLTLSHQPNDSLSLYENYITGMVLAPDGDIWLAHYRGKISVLNPQTLKVRRIDVPEAGGSTIGRLFFDSKKRLWLYIAGKGLHEHVQQNGKDVFIPWGPLSNMPEGATSSQISVYQGITTIHEDEQHQIWLGTNNGLYRLDESKKKIVYVSPASHRKVENAFIHNILPQGDSVFWLTSYGEGIIRYNRITGEHTSYLFEKGFRGTHNVIYSAVWKNDEEILFHNNGLASFNTRTRQFNFMYDTSRLELLNLGSILKDRNRIIWVSSTNGLLRYEVETSLFTYHSLNVTRSDNGGNYLITGVVNDQTTGRTIISTSFADGIHVFDRGGRDHVLPIPMKANAEPYRFGRIVRKLSDGRILALSRDNLLEITPDNKLKIISGPTDLFAPHELPYLYRLIETRNGDLWIASSRNGLIRYSKSNKHWTRFTTSNSSIKSNTLLDIEEDSKGLLWLAYANQGIGYFNPATGEAKSFTYRESDPQTIISDQSFDLTVDHQDRIWVAALEGISIYDQSLKTFKRLTKASGLPVQAVYSVATDIDGNVWAAGYSRVIALKPDLSVREFGYYEGLSGTYPDFVLIEGENGEMFMGGTGGYFSFDSRTALSHESIESPMVITGATIGKNNIRYFEEGGIALTYDSNHVQVSFAALNFMSGKNMYEYRMEGLDKTWSETQSNHVTYSGLPSGNFLFRVRLKGADNKEATLHITVSTPFWNTIWFKAIVIVIAMGAVYILYRLRGNQIRSEEKLKFDFNQQLAEAETKALKAQMSPHFIFNSLNSINRYIIKAEPEKASLYLTKFSKLIRLILDNSNQKIISLEQEVTALKLYIELEALRFNEKFTFRIHVAPDISANSIGVPPMIIQPFVENAIWHGLLHKPAPGHLDVEFERFADGLKCTITDNGIGREKAAELKSKSVNQEKSYGIQITRDRLSMLDKDSKTSHVEVINLTDKLGNAAGTRVIVKIMSAELDPDF